MSSWGEISVAPFMEWFADSVWEELPETSRMRLSFILNRFVLRFDRMPERGELIRWIASLERARPGPRPSEPAGRGDGLISAATMGDYYKRLRFVYRCAVEAYPPAAQLAPLPYQSFRPKAWSRNGSEPE